MNTQTAVPIPNVSITRHSASFAGGWSRYFGYDIFISFALGPSPRGCRAYASDLARRLRERGFTVFFSEDEAPVGGELDSTLRRALHRSRVLVVVINNGTLADPRWVRTEVEEFRRKRSRAAIVPINIGGALQDPVLAEQAEPWLRFTGRIWIDENAEAAQSGQVSEAVIERLVTAPHAVRSVVRLRTALGLIFAVLALLTFFAFLQRNNAVDERDRAHQELLSSAARQALLLSRDGRAHEGWDGLVAALTVAQPSVDGRLPENFLEAALTSLVENRNGPELKFDESVPPPKRGEEDDDTTPPIFAFDTKGEQVAVAAGRYVAVWSTQDGHRKAQALLPIHPEQLTFTAHGAVLVAQGREQAPTQLEVPTDPPSAVAFDIASGRQMSLPLALCERWIPCIAGREAAPRLLPLTELPPFDQLQTRSWSQGPAYLAAAAGSMQTQGVSRQRFVLLLHDEPESDSQWLLLDRQTGGVLTLPTEIEKGADPTNFAMARDAPVLVESSPFSSAIVVYRIEEGAKAPLLVESRKLRALQSAGTQNVRLDPKGTMVMYENFRYGTGTGVGIGRTAVIDLDSGRERWARDEGEVAWGNSLLALQENWADTHVLSATTGATWFVSPGQPLGFDPSERMLLMWDMSDAPWPSVRLLESLPVRQFARDARGPASKRSVCDVFPELRFLTLSERLNRVWNRDDWHRQPLRDVERPAPFASTPSEPTDSAERLQWVSLRPKGGRWQVETDSDTGVLLDRAEVERRYPLLTSALRHEKPLQAHLSSSEDGRWIGVVISTDADKAPNTACNGISTWQLHRAGEAVPVRSGCTTGELAGPNDIPQIHFLPPAEGMLSPLLAVVPTDTCEYEILEPEGGSTLGMVIPAFGNTVRFERIASDLLAVTSSDWYGATRAYQLHALGAGGTGPVFIIAERNEGDKNEGEAAASLEMSQALYLPSLPSTEEIGDSATDETNEPAVTFEAGGRELRIADKGWMASIRVPPWGKRLRERLQRDVEMRVMTQK